MSVCERVQALSCWFPGLELALSHRLCYAHPGKWRNAGSHPVCWTGKGCFVFILPRCSENRLCLVILPS